MERRKKIKIRIEINEIENQYHNREDQRSSKFFEKANKIDKPLETWRA